MSGAAFCGGVLTNDSRAGLQPICWFRRGRWEKEDIIDHTNITKQAPATERSCGRALHT